MKIALGDLVKIFAGSQLKCTQLVVSILGIHCITIGTRKIFGSIFDGWFFLEFFFLVKIIFDNEDKISKIGTNEKKMGQNWDSPS